MIPKLFIPFDDVREIAMYACYSAVFDKERDLVDGSLLSEILNKYISARVLDRHILLLHEDKLLLQWNEIYRKVSIELIRKVEEGIRRRERPYYELRVKGPQWLLGQYSLPDEDAENIYIPASDRIVALDDNQRRALIKPLEEISKEIKTSNSTRDALGEEADRVSAEVDAGITLAKSGRFRLSAIIVVLMKPLKFIADKFRARR